MQVRFFGGLSVSWGADEGTVPGRGQQALLLRLAVDAGTTVGYRALADDVWPSNSPEDPRAALQSLASRLRRTLPEGLLASAPGGYRLDLPREQVDITLFQDLVATARRGPWRECPTRRDCMPLTKPRQTATEMSGGCSLVRVMGSG